MEAAPDGRFWELVEVHYRSLTSQGGGDVSKDHPVLAGL
jgi:hypothetical protein